MLEKTLESPLDSKEIKPVSPKGNQYWIFIGRTDAEAPIFWSPDLKNWLIGETLILGKIEGRTVALKVREQVMRMKTEHEIWCNGSRDLQPLIGLRCRVHSESSFYSWLQTTKLSLIYLSQDTTLTQSRSCFYPRPFPSGIVLGTISKCIGSDHT